VIHGYMSGHYAIEARMWPLKRIFDLGFDLVFSVLPFHGPRRAEARGFLPPAFPSNDPRFTIEGFRQTVLDHRALFDYLCTGRVASLGVMGMSLGGYSAALLATLEAALEFAVLLVPLAAIEDVALRQGRMLGNSLEQVAQRDALRQAQWAVSPLARPALVPSERAIVLAGEADLVTGPAQARQLARHFSARLSLFHGGHLLQAGRELAFAPVWRLLAELAADRSAPLG
jgi:pimeloyl-ACP methyl ester carboxylesterase